MPDQFPSPVDPATGLPASPTGTPLLPPAVARYVTLAVVLALAVLGSLTAIYSESKGLQVALAITTAIAAVLGIASPGLRRQVVVLLMAGALVTSGSGCAWWKSHPTFQASLQRCAGKVVSADTATALLPEVVKAVSGKPVDWQPSLDALVMKSGEAAICAIVALVEALASGQGGSAVSLPEQYDREAKAAFLRAYLRSVD